MRVTIREVAEVAGTSVSTVSRVLTGSAPVSDDKRKAVEKAITELNYRPSQVARGLKTKSTKTLGLLINDITNPFYSSIAQSAEDEANRHGYSLMLCHIYESPENELQNLQMLYDKGVDGIIFGPTGKNQDYINRLSHLLPLVQIDRRLNGLNVPAIVVDNENGAFEAVNLLIEKGHRRIGLLRWPSGVNTPKERTKGYFRALKKAGIEINKSLITTPPKFSPKDLIQLARDLIIDHPRPSAIFAQNCQLGIGALRAIQEEGLRIPQDIALVVFDDIETFELTTPQITAVAQPTRTIGRRAVQLLIDKIEQSDSRVSEVIILATELIIRGSV